LFADLLRDLQNARQEDQTAALHQRASQWYAQAGGECGTFAGEAIQHALAAADYALAVDLLESHATDMIMQGYAKTVDGWVQAIPQEWRSSSKTHLAFAPVDAFHLGIGLPILLSSMWLARRGKLVGLLCWPGALLYVLYSFVLNLVGMPFDVLFLPYLLLVVLSAYTLLCLVTSIDGEAVRQKLSGVVPEKSAAGVLIVLTGLFVLNVINETTTALVNQTPVGPLDSMLWIADSTTLSPVFILGGYLLWRREALGYVGGAGMLLAYIMLFAGLLPVSVFPAFYDASPIEVGNAVFALVMVIICLVPFVRFVRGIVAERDSSPTWLAAGPVRRIGPIWPIRRCCGQTVGSLPYLSLQLDKS
jgi:hypothetical protein